MEILYELPPGKNVIYVHDYHNFVNKYCRMNYSICVFISLWVTGKVEALYNIGLKA